MTPSPKKKAMTRKGDKSLKLGKDWKEVAKRKGEAWFKKNCPIKPQTIWIVAIRCNLDDVIIGAYTKWAAALLRMKDALLGPAEDLKRHPSPSDRWDNSGLIGVAIYKAEGDKVQNWTQVNFGDEKKAA